MPNQLISVLFVYCLKNSHWLITYSQLPIRLPGPVTRIPASHWSNPKYFKISSNNFPCHFHNECRIFIGLTLINSCFVKNIMQPILTFHYKVQDAQWSNQKILQYTFGQTQKHCNMSKFHHKTSPVIYIMSAGISLV